jgi:deoxyribodipyrimidine photo-lyase
MSTAIWWLRRDLRLHDNPALMAAIRHDRVIPLFIFDPFFTKSPHVGSKRLSFLYSTLLDLSSSLARYRSRLILREGAPLDILRAIMHETNAELIYASEDYSPYARKRDAAVSRDLPVKWVGSPGVHPPGSITKSNGEPYTVFTPFSKSWKKLPTPNLVDTLSNDEYLNTPEDISSTPPGDLNISYKSEQFPVGESSALSRLHDFTEGKSAPIYQYAEMRNRIDSDLTSKLSPYLKFGSLSPKRAVSAALNALKNSPDSQAEKGAEIWLNELIWREFYLHILYHFPKVRKTNFRKQEISWANDPEDFDAWKNGLTGYPIVDAGMRQLSQEGWIHNRLRMIVASFLVKDLLIDWRWGERWFMQHLIDGDPASNNGGWQWTAGTGTDAAPYFRIFNPILQSKKFDPRGMYIRSQIPELTSVPNTHIHAPWEMSAADQKKYHCVIGEDYPSPLIDHKWARQRTLEAYRQQ